MIASSPSRLKRRKPDVSRHETATCFRIHRDVASLWVSFVTEAASIENFPMLICVYLAKMSTQARPEREDAEARAQVGSGST